MQNNKDEKEEIKQQSPSDKWTAFTDSKFSDRHLTQELKQKRTSKWYLTAANITKMYIGISFISTPKAVSQAGLFGSIIGFIFAIFINSFCLYIYLKARNRFKNEVIVDMGDLASKLYGPWAKILISIVLVVNNSLYLLCYILFIGLQTDQLSCKTFKTANCGYENTYSALLLISLLPVLMIKQLKYIGFFSIFILIFTFIAIIIIIVLCSKIIALSPQEIKDNYNITVTDQDRDYVYWDAFMIPVFCAQIMTLYGNQSILNLYSEYDNPKNFFLLTFIIIVSLTVFVAAAIGYVGYLAFGASVKSVILLNLPNQDPSAITAKVCYILTIMGSFVLLINPIYYIIENTQWYKGYNNNESQQDGQEMTCCQIFKYIFWRTFIVLLVYFISLFVPNINILLTIGGSLLGVILSIFIPVIFYNRAYANTEKNLRLQKREKEEDEQNLIKKEENEIVNKNEDKRYYTKICSWVTLSIGIIMGLIGLSYVIYKIVNNKTQSDSNN